MSVLVFLSHSSPDKPFVRELDHALGALGIKTFLDERDILVGDDIPARIYEGIEAATHLCYVISANSVKSKWVADEVSTAKMREKDQRGLVILPILIDDVAVPTAVRSRKYGDFRSFKIGQRMLDFGAFQELALVLKVTKTELLRARCAPSSDALLDLILVGADAAIAVDSVRVVLFSIAGHVSSALSAMPPDRRKYRHQFDWNSNWAHRSTDHYSPEAREREAITRVFEKNTRKLMDTIRFSDVMAKLCEYESKVSIQVLAENPNWQAKLGSELISSLQSFREGLADMFKMRPAAHLSVDMAVSRLSNCAALLGTMRRFEYALLSRRGVLVDTQT